MSSFIGVTVGLLIGTILLELPGAIFGGALGLLISKVQQLSQLLAAQQNIINALKDEHDAKTKQSSVASSAQTGAIDPETNIDNSQSIITTTSSLSERLGPLDEALESANTSNSQIQSQQHATVAAATASQTLSKKSDPWVQQRRNAESVVTKSSEQSPLSSLLELVLAKTNLVTRVGIVVLFFGVAFLLKYTAEHSAVTIEMRLSLVAAAAAVLLFIGWKLRKKRAAYAVLMQGAAVGIWYLSTYASLNLYQVMPASVGFSLMLLVSVIAVALAVMQDAKALAVFAIAGGFLAPILASTGSGSHVTLFSYYAVLNVGIVAITWFKTWRSLTLLGFIFTFVIGVAWGVTSYSPEHFNTTEPFLILFILFYIAVVMMFALRKQWQHSPVLDGPLVFGTPVIGFVLQSQLVQNFDRGMAWSALLFGLCYLAIVYHWRKALTAHSPLLKESFLAIGVVLVSLAIPYAFDFDVTALLWTLEGVGGLWLAVRQRRLWGCILALLAQLGAGVAWLMDAPSSGQYLFANSDYLSAVLIALAALYSAWLLQAQSKKCNYHQLHTPALAWGLCWWLGSAVWQFDAHLEGSYQPAAALLFVTVSAVWFQLLRDKLRWQTLTPVLVAMLPSVLIITVMSFNVIDKPSQSLGFIAWPAALLCLYWLYNKGALFIDGFIRQECPWHGATFILAVGLASWEILWQVGDNTSLESWTLMAAGFASLIAVWLVTKIRFWRPELNSLYREKLVALLFFGLLFNALICNFIEPVIAPLKYLPLLNPLDVWQLAIIASVIFWWRNHPITIIEKLPIKTGWIIIAAVLFIYINTLLFRTVHISTDIPFKLQHLLNADLVQTSLSILWTSLGITLFLATKRWPKREFWIAGVSLFGIVVIKLFLVDLANTGTVARIVSFMGVGLLLLAVGYLVPIPEQQAQDSAKA